MVIKQGIIVKAIIFVVTFIVFCSTYILVVYSDEISDELTHNLNRNLDVNWGENHPKFKKQHLNVDLLDLSVSWDFFNIVFPLTQGAHILNALSTIKTTGCISKIALSLNIHIDINCNEIRIEIKRNKWTKNGGLHISRTFFFERRVFDDFYGKQGNYNVNIDTNNFVVNNEKLGHYRIEYSFIDKQKLQLIINEEDVILTKKPEGLNIHTPDSDFFILNRNYYENTRKLDSAGV